MEVEKKREADESEARSWALAVVDVVVEAPHSTVALEVWDLELLRCLPPVREKDFVAVGLKERATVEQDTNARN